MTGPEPTAPRKSGGGFRRIITIALLLLTALPATFGLIDLWLDRGGPYLPYGDHAILALVVDDVGRHEVLLGAYSRFGWFHPGPIGTYLMAASNYLLGDALQALSAGMLVASGVSAVAAVWLVRRRAGVVAGVWALLVLTLSVHLLGDDFIRDSWNPYLPVLPFLAGVLLCWTAIRGDAWALPLAVVPMSLAVQSHIGFLPAVGAVEAVLVVGLLLRAVRRWRRRSPESASAGAELAPRRPRRWLFAGVAAVAVGGLLWLPSIVQQVTRRPGNAGVLYDYLLNGSADAPAGISTGLRAVADEFGKLPAYVVGAGRPAAPFLPELWPPVAIAIGIASFVGAMALAVRRRREDVLWLGALTSAVAVAGVAAIARIDGPPYPYLVQWTVVIGILVWTTVGLSLLPELQAAVRSASGRARPGLWPEIAMGVPLAALTSAVVLIAAIGTGRADTPSTDVTGKLVRLEQAVVADLDGRGLRTGSDRAVVRVDFAGTTRPDHLVGTLWPGAGLVLGLDRDGIDVQVRDFWRTPFGRRYTERVEDATYVVTLAYSDGTSPPPEDWQQVLAVDGEFEVYGGVPPGP